ncbi:MAG: FecR family protein [Aggregatilineales bacterium]
MSLHKQARNIAAASAAVVFVAAFIPLILTSASPQAQAFAATVQPLGGLVQELKAGQSTWQTINRAGLLSNGDQLRTGDHGAVLVTTATGVKISVYPDTIIQLDNLSLAADSSALTFIISQPLGITYTDIGRTLKPGDLVQVVTPTVAASVHGTKFYTFVGTTGHTAIIGEKNPVDVLGAKASAGQNGADNLAYFGLDLTGAPSPCTIDFLANSSGVILKDLISDTNQQTFRDFLTEFYRSNINPKATAFYVQLLGLPTTATSADILNALPKFKPTVTLADFLTSLRKLLVDYFTAESAVGFAPSTCGNGQKDPGETPTNCAADTADLSKTYNNGLCELAAGKSFFNDAVDCLPFGATVQSCVTVLYGGLNHITPTPVGRPILNPPTATPVPPKTPHPSGAGG